MKTIFLLLVEGCLSHASLVFPSDLIYSQEALSVDRSLLGRGQWKEFSLALSFGLATCVGKVCLQFILWTIADMCC